VTEEIMISERPAEAEDRAVPGHWEGDLIIGLESSAIGTLVERSSRFTMLLHLPPMTDQGPRVKNGPALAGHGAEAVRAAIADTITTLPEQLRRSLTWDQGTEMAQHAQLRVNTGLPVYFCDPHSPWQRGRRSRPRAAARFPPYARPGWSAFVTAAKLSGRWQLIEVGPVYPLNTSGEDEISPHSGCRAPSPLSPRLVTFVLRPPPGGGHRVTLMTQNVTQGASGSDPVAS